MDYTQPAGSAADWQPGLLLGHKYQLIERLPRGSFGHGWKAKDVEATDGSGLVTLKPLPLEIVENPQEFTKMRRHFQQVHALVHKNIARYIGMVQDGPECMAASEWIEGRSLDSYREDWLSSQGTITPEVAILIFRQIASALDFAHSQGVLHRDLRPNNVMLDNRSVVKVLDFGLTAEIRAAISRANGHVADLPAARPYIAPEIWEGKPPRAESDQYALAALFYEFLCGYPPFTSEDSIILRQAVLTAKPDPLPQLSAETNAALFHALAKDPTKRFRTCTGMMRALAGEEASVRKTGSSATLIPAWSPPPPVEETRYAPAPVEVAAAPVAAPSPAPTSAGNRPIGPVAPVQSERSPTAIRRGETEVRHESRIGTSVRERQSGAQGWEDMEEETVVKGKDGHGRLYLFLAILLAVIAGIIYWERERLIPQNVREFQTAPAAAQSETQAAPIPPPAPTKRAEPPRETVRPDRVMVMPPARSETNAP